jgi:hypothetical protein
MTHQRYIAFTSIIGDFAVLAGFGGVIADGFIHHELHFNVTTDLNTPAGVPQMIGECWQDSAVTVTVVDTLCEEREGRGERERGRNVYCTERN